jgi:hypothetical protein
MPNRPTAKRPRTKSSVEVAKDAAREAQRTLQSAEAAAASHPPTSPISPELLASIQAATKPVISPELLASIQAATKPVISPELLASIEAARATISSMPASWLTGQQILGAIQSSATSSTASSTALTEYLRQIDLRNRTRHLRVAEPVSPDRSARPSQGRSPRQPPAKAVATEPEPPKPPSDAALVVLAIKEAVGDLGSQVRDMGQIAAASSAELAGLRTDIQASSKKAASLQTAANAIAVILVILTIVLAAPTVVQVFERLTGVKL